MKKFKKILCLALLVLIAPMFFISCNENEIKDLNAKITELEAENSKLRTEKNRLEETNNTNNSTILYLNQRINTLTQERDDLSAEKEDLTAEKETLEKDKKTLTDDKNLLEQEKISLNNQITAKNEEITKVENEKTSLNAQITAKDAQIASLNIQLNVANADKEAAQKQIEDLEAEKKELNDELTAKQTQIDSLTTQKNSLQTQLNEKTTALEEKETLLNQKEDEITTLNSQLAQKETAIAGLNNQISALETEKTNLQNENNELKTEIERFRTADLRFGETYNGSNPLVLNKVESNIHNTYMFFNCTFENGIEVLDKDVDLRFFGCVFNLGSSSNFIKATSLSNLDIEDCTFEGTFSSDLSENTVIDLNLYSTAVRTIVISNNEFKVSNGTGASNKAVAIAIKTRLGATDTVDAETETWAKDQTAGTINSVVLIENNLFTETCNVINIGAKSVNADGSANISTGAFEVKVTGATKEGYASNISVYELYLDASSETTVAETVYAEETKTFGNKTVRESA